VQLRRLRFACNLRRLDLFTVRGATRRSLGASRSQAEPGNEILARPTWRCSMHPLRWNRAPVAPIRAFSECGTLCVAMACKHRNPSMSTAGMSFANQIWRTYQTRHIDRRST
jgi:hypothetical protein